MEANNTTPGKTPGNRKRKNLTRRKGKKTKQEMENAAKGDGQDIMGDDGHHAPVGGHWEGYYMDPAHFQGENEIHWDNEHYMGYYVAAYPGHAAYYQDYPGPYAEYGYPMHGHPETIPRSDSRPGGYHHRRHSSRSHSRQSRPYRPEIYEESWRREDRQGQFENTEHEHTSTQSALRPEAPEFVPAKPRSELATNHVPSEPLVITSEVRKN